MFNNTIIVRDYLPAIDVVIINEPCRKPLNRILVELSQLLAEQEGGLQKRFNNFYTKHKFSFCYLVIVTHHRMNVQKSKALGLGLCVLQF